MALIFADEYIKVEGVAMDPSPAFEKTQTRLQTLLIVAVFIFGAGFLAASLDFVNEDLDWFDIVPLDGYEAPYPGWLFPLIALIRFVASLAAVLLKGNRSLNRMAAYTVAVFLIFAPLSVAIILLSLGLPSQDENIAVTEARVAEATAFLDLSFKGAIGIWIFACLLKTRERTSEGNPNSISDNQP